MLIQPTSMAQEGLLTNIGSVILFVGSLTGIPALGYYVTESALVTGLIALALLLFWNRFANKVRDGEWMEAHGTLNRIGSSLGIILLGLVVVIVLVSLLFIDLQKR